MVSLLFSPSPRGLSQKSPCNIGFFFPSRIILPSISAIDQIAPYGARLKAWRVRLSLYFCLQSKFSHTRQEFSP